MNKCKHCKECQDYLYERINKKGNLVSFIYCNGNKEIVENHNWWIQSRGYAITSDYVDGKQKYLHHFCKDDTNNIIDHYNGNRRDNRLSNLLEMSQTENCQNRHDMRSNRFCGVYHDKIKGVYKSVINIRISDDGKYRVKYLGEFGTPLEAFHRYVQELKVLGKPINTTTREYKEYRCWLDEQAQTRLC